MKNLVDESRPRSGGAAVLSGDLASLVREIVPDGTNIVFNSDTPTSHELSRQEADALVSIAREALISAVHRCKASTIAIDVRQADGDTTLLIQDDGADLDVDHLEDACMRTLAQGLGVELLVSAIPGMGTLVRVALPRSLQDGEGSRA